MNYGRDEDGGVCDASWHNDHSNDWKGPSWYRIDGPAGSRFL